MNEKTLQDYQTLHALLIQERECVISIDMEELQRVVEEKSNLLGNLLPVDEDELTPGFLDLAEQIQQENRRNAYLFWSSLNWVRDTMTFYSRQISNPTYGGRGEQVTTVNGGNLLSGKV